MAVSTTFLPNLIVLSLILIAALVCFIPCMSPHNISEMRQESMYSAYEGFDPATSSEDAAPMMPEEKIGGLAEQSGGAEKEDDAPMENFRVLSPAAYNAPGGEILDKFSQIRTYGKVDGQDGCNSSGLSNSKGYLCLTPELLGMLKTRGGNA
jgi:hypothetical protein